MKLAVTKREIGAGIAALALLGWGAWTTKNVLEPKQEIVRVNAAGLVQEFMVSVAHSNWSPEEIGQRTALYTKALDDLIAKESEAGRTVLMTEAVLSKNTPDITPKIRAELHKIVPWSISNNPSAAGTPISNYSEVAKSVSSTGGQ